MRVGSARPAFSERPAPSFMQMRDVRRKRSAVHAILRDLDDLVLEPVYLWPARLSNAALIDIVLSVVYQLSDYAVYSQVTGSGTGGMLHMHMNLHRIPMHERNTEAVCNLWSKRGLIGKRFVANLAKRSALDETHHNVLTSPGPWRVGNIIVQHLLFRISNGTQQIHGYLRVDWMSAHAPATSGIAVAR